MASGEIHAGDTGTAFRLLVRDEEGEIVNLAGASLLMMFTKPSGELVEKTATLYSDGTDGLMQYVTIAGDLDEVGGWKYQGRVAFGSATFSTDIQRVKIHKNLD